MCCSFPDSRGLGLCLLYRYSVPRASPVQPATTAFSLLISSSLQCITLQHQACVEDWERVRRRKESFFICVSWWKNMISQKTWPLASANQQDVSGGGFGRRGMKKAVERTIKKKKKLKTETDRYSGATNQHKWTGAVWFLTGTNEPEAEWEGTEAGRSLKTRRSSVMLNVPFAFLACTYTTSKPINSPRAWAPSWQKGRRQQFISGCCSGWEEVTPRLYKAQPSSY